jgi:hypothetical protein
MKQQWEPPELEEMPIVILSLHQKWWQKMAAGEKALELRKTKPQCKAPFRVLVYVTGGVGKQQWRCSTWQQGNPESRKHRRANAQHYRGSWDI